MPTINPNFRPDPNRAVCVFGEINDDLVSKIGPEIVRLRAAGPAPITVFINSNGGDVRCADYIHGLLSARDQNGKRVNVITVAIGNARSAAANLLTLGTYAIAYPKASIHFHGVRYGEVENVTKEHAESMAAQLQSRNKSTVQLLSEAATSRLTFHYARLKAKFPDVRKSLGNESLVDIECFAKCIRKNLSSNATFVLDKAISRWQWLQELSAQIVGPAKKSAEKSGKMGVHFSSLVLRKIIQYEVRRNKGKRWDLDENGIYQIVSDFLLLRDYDLGTHNSLMNMLTNRFRRTFFTPDELELLNGDQKNSQQVQDMFYDRVEKTVKPLCYFASSILLGLQEEENALTPKDGYWLGTVDEVYDSKLPCIRELVESYNPQQTDLPSPASNAPKPPGG